MIRTGTRYLSLIVFAVSVSSAYALPVPKEGLLVPKSNADEIRRKVLTLQDAEAMVGKKGIRTVADQAIAEWPKVKPTIEKHVGKMLDVLHQGNPRDFVADDVREAAQELGSMVHALANLGFMYFLTGEQQYAKTAYEILEMAGRVPRWGWFNWGGANMPQIHYGQYARNAAFCVDFCWSGWNKSQQRKAVDIVAEKAVESYWRLVSIAPFMGLHHLRSKNQGNNALSAALIASLAVGDSVPENKVWFDSLLTTYCWIIAHDIGWAGTGLESGLPGYWSVSMQNLYTAAACLNNARSIDLRVHPGFAEATWYPVMHEATVPPHSHGRFNQPYPKDEVGLSGTMEHKPLELPSVSYGGAWWYDYAANFPDSPAMYFISENFQGRIAKAHQSGHAEIMDLLWVRTMSEPARVPRPTALFKSTDREAMFRSGYGSPHTFLSFNGDMFLSARNEVLCCTSGLAWHFPWHQYAVTESVLETEGNPFSPSMQITDSFDSDIVSMISSKSWTSNVKYYRRDGQARSHKEYKTRTRDIIYVRSDQRDETYDYFVFVDRVEHEGARWHSFNWHIWDSPGNEGRYEILGDNTVIARRPNAGVYLATVSHGQMTYEQQKIPSQPLVSYTFDHNARLLRAIAGGSQRPKMGPVTLPSKLWRGGKVAKVDDRQTVLIEAPKGKTLTFRSPIQLESGCRYRVSLTTRKEDARIYESFAWIVNLKLLGNAGKVLMDADQAHSFRDPHPLKLTAPASNEATCEDWKETTTHFTAPEDVAAVEATFLPATWRHSTSLKPTSKIYLSDMVFTPLGVPERTDKETIVTVAVPMENDGPSPKIQSSRQAGVVRADVTHPDGTRDRMVVDADGRVEISRQVKLGKSAFGWRTTRLPLGSFESTVPLQVALTEKAGKLTGKFVVDQAAEVSVAGKKFTASAGSHLFDGRRRPDPRAPSLKSNSAKSQQLLKTGLAPLAERIVRDRDKYTKMGWKNIALDAADVYASATQDERFAPANVIDNKTWEIPIDGVVDYTIGSIRSTQGFGYGRMEAMSYHESQSEWPFFFRPTYWLLPPRQLGEVTIELKEPARIRMVRLLNTCNAGLNDFATTKCRVTLLSDRKSPRWTKKVTLGREWDRAFDAAFARPEFFASYGAAFDGILERGAIVPFGAGWLDVPVDCDEPIQYVRVDIREFWGAGGGINEVQVYPAE